MEGNMGRNHTARPTESDFTQGLSWAMRAASSCGCDIRAIDPPPPVHNPEAGPQPQKSQLKVTCRMTGNDTPTGSFLLRRATCTLVDRGIFAYGLKCD